MDLEIAASLQSRFPGLLALVTPIRGVSIRTHSADVDTFREGIVEEILARYTLEKLKDEPLFRAYRDFFWRVGVDPTKNRPASEALIRRILQRKPVPSINTLVDAYNLASIKTGVPLAAFDLDKLQGALLMRTASPGESFLGIGMSTPMVLQGGEVVVSDAARLVAVYPYRDAESSKVTDQTRNVLLMTCGCPGITKATLEAAQKEASQIVVRFCGGTTT
jgi:DNA/RNA-binding domain of Phe-tRNA-synthetase-like protein